MKKYCIIGDDNRSNYIRKIYTDLGVKITDYFKADYVIAPIPFSRDGIRITDTTINCEEFITAIEDKILFTGAIKESIKKKLKNIKYYDLMEMDDVAILNAIPTAEGAILKAIENSDITIHGSNCLVMGYGRIGKILASMLKGIGANVYCEARKKKDLAFIEAYGYHKVALEDINNCLSHMDYIFNTIPIQLLDEQRLHLVKKDTIIIDLASAPGGIDLKKAKELGLNVIWALSLPGKVAPKTAAIYLKDIIDKIIKEESL
ncbi:MAG: dipicolinate synthase subunit DpsA [Clostridia bacterium]|nr:dipicolinate synthase subunit DpsA [Clostridia bacterium]